MTSSELERWRRLYAYLQNHDEISNAQARELWGVSESTAKRLLSKPSEMALLKKSGIGKKAVYRKNDNLQLFNVAIFLRERHAVFYLLQGSMLLSAMSGHFFANLNSNIT